MVLKNDYAATGDPFTAVQADALATQVNANTSDILAGEALTPTTKTGAYTASVGDFVICDASAAAFTVTLPNTPSAKSRVAVKKIDVVVGNTVTVAAAGADKFNSTIGPTSLALNGQNHALVFEYTSGVWNEVSTNTGSPSTFVSNYANLAGAFSALPSAGFAGREYRCTDVGLVLRDNGTSWDRVWIGPHHPTITAPPASSWTTVNLGGATFSNDLDGRLLVTPDTAGASLRIEYQTLSPTSNYTFTTYLEATAAGLDTDFWWGMCLLNNSNALITWGGYTASGGTNHQISIDKHDSATVVNSNYAFLNLVKLGAMPNWFRIRDNGTNRYFDYSLNGIDWIELFSVGRTDFITPTRIGWYTGNNSGGTRQTRLRSWLVA